MANKNIAIMYDFDKTLSPKDMQEYGFIPSIGMESNEFWGMADSLAKKYSMDKILSYMYLMIKQAKKKDISITRNSFRELGKDVILFDGVEDWFDRINAFANKQGYHIEHFILSSGLKEIIEGTKIFDKFKNVYACEFHYNDKGNADWPLRAVNYTAKTQYIFRISKGVLDVTDDYSLNSKIDDTERFIPYKNMIYIGDGITDVPCMKIVKEKGGHSIAIYQDKDSTVPMTLVNDDRINFLCRADYSQGSDVEKAVKLIIKKLSIDSEIDEAISEQSKKFLNRKK